MKRVLLLCVTFGLMVAPVHAAELHLKVPLPPLVDVRFGPCPGFSEGAGCTWRGGPVYVDLAVTSEEGMPPRDALYHELGHQFDFQDGTAKLRRAFRRTVHGRWDREKFADAYMMCAYSRRYEKRRWDSWRHVESDYYNYSASWKAHRRFCRTIRRGSGTGSSYSRQLR